VTAPVCTFRARLLGALLLAAVIAATLPVPAALGQSAPPDGCPEPFPLEELTEGMIATGWTVSRGDDPEPFTVEILGVQSHFFLHDRSIIVGDADRPGNDAIHRAGGIWAGMSGSPLYAPDGRLIGALAFGFSFGPSKIAGFTPAQEMLDVLAYPRGVGAPAEVTLFGALAEEVNRREAASTERPTMVPAPAPFPVRDARVARVVNDLAARERLPITAVPVTTRQATSPVSISAAPRAGGNFGAAFSYGDGTRYASGTTTFVCEDQAMAFGHWFAAAGATTLGANDGRALTVIDDPTFGPYKMMNLTGLFGTVDQDRFAGVRTDLGRIPETAPVTTDLTDRDTGVNRTSRTDVVFADALPFLAALDLWDATDSTIDRWGRGTSELTWTATGTTADGEQWALTRGNVFASDYDIGVESIFEMWSMLDTVRFNDFVEVEIDDVAIVGELEEAVRRVRIADVAVSVDGGEHLPPEAVEPVRPGSTIDLRIHLVGKGTDRVVDLELVVPADAVEFAQIVVTGGAAGELFVDGGILNGEPPGSGVIASFEDLLTALEEQPQHNDLVARFLSYGDWFPEPEPWPDFGIYTEHADGTLARARLDDVVSGEWYIDLFIEHDNGELPPETGVTRLEGRDRIATAVAVSQDAFPFEGSASTVVIARADDYADALTGGPLAAAEYGPLLLTSSEQLDDLVAAEIQRLGATRSIVLGGTAALSERVMDDLRDVGARPQRVAGANRFDTARLIAGRLGADEVYLALGHHPEPHRAWADAIAVSGLAALQRRPILLTTGDTVPPETDQALRDLAVRTATIVGGGAAVSEAVAEAVRTGHDRRVVDRLAGATRYETSVAIADASVAAGADPMHIWLATGRGYADGLAAGPAAAAWGGVLLMIDGQDLDGSSASRAWLEQHAGAPTQLRLVGGTAAITEHAAAQVRAVLDHEEAAG
jgi:putative cell wall-binding protein